MNLIKHFIRYGMEMMGVYGAVLIIVLVYKISIGEPELSVKSMGGYLLLVVALMTRIESLINFHDLKEHLMRINYMISSVLADVSLLFLLYHFTESGKEFRQHGVSILIVYAVLKLGLYIGMYVFNVYSAKEINKRLLVYKNF